MHMSTLTILDVVVHNVAYMRSRFYLCIDHTSKKREIGLYKKEKIFSLKFLMPILIASTITKSFKQTWNPGIRFEWDPWQFLRAF